MGTIGTLIIIIGACMCLGGLFESMSSQDEIAGIKIFILGIALGIIGCCMIGVGI